MFAQIVSSPQMSAQSDDSTNLDPSKNTSISIVDSDSLKKPINRPLLGDQRIEKITHDLITNALKNQNQNGMQSLL